MDRALLVGINKYPGAPLAGCVNDASNMAQLIVSRYRFDEKNIRLLVDERASTENIIKELEWLTEPLVSGDRALFHFSGHGVQVATRNFKREVDGLDEVVCVGSDSIIPTSEGLLHADRLWAMVNSEKQVKAKVGSSYYPIRAAYRTTKQSFIKVTTTDGRVTSFGDEHPVFVFDEGFAVKKQANNLSPGDLLLTSHGVYENADLDDFWYLVGLFVGDGHFLSRNTIRFGVRSYKSFWRGICRIAENSLPDCELRIRENSRGDLVICMKSNFLCTKLREMGFRPGQRKTGLIKELPMPIYKEVIKGFLRGLFDADGTSSFQEVSLVTTDAELVNHVTMCLRFFGISTCFSMVSSKEPKKNDAYRVAMNNHEAVKFLDRIGFGIKEKSRKVRRELGPCSGKSGNFYLPCLVNIIKKWNLKGKHACEAMGLRGRSLRRMTTSRFTRDQTRSLVRFLRGKVSVGENVLDGKYEDRMLIGASVGQISKLSGRKWHNVCDDMRRRSDYSGLHSYADNLVEDLHNFTEGRNWDILDDYDVVPIVKVEHISDQADMFDFTVDNQNKFECNGFLVHNCPVDFNWTDRRMIRDKQLYGIFRRINEGVRFAWVNDSCHSGDLTRDMPVNVELPRTIPSPPDIAWDIRVAKAQELCCVGMSPCNHVMDVHSKAITKGVLDVGFVSGCKSTQTSADTVVNGVPCGALTYYLVKQLGKMPKKTPLYKVVEATSKELAKRGYSQRPQAEGGRRGNPFLG